MRQIVNVAAMIFLLSLFFFSNQVAAYQPDGKNYRYMEVIRDSEIYALIGEHVIQVGTFREGQSLQVVQDEGEDSDYYVFRFGNGKGYIAKNHLKEIKKAQFPSDPFPILNNKVAQGLATFQKTKVYSTLKVDSKPIAVLAADLRYPIQDKVQDIKHNIWYEINLGGRLGYIRAQDAEQDNGIPVLTYHHILNDKENKRFLHTSTTTSLNAFRSQMDYLKQAGYTTISLYELEGYLKGTINLPAKVVALTFDDGLKSVYRYAYPILKKNGQEATLFIISSRIKRHPQKWNPNNLQFLSLNELLSMQDVFDFQSHTHFLHRLDKNKKPILFKRSYRNILYDFERSRRALSQFNPHVIYLSYPFGGYNMSAMKAAKNAGFHLAVTTVQGKVKLGDNPFSLKRLYILRTDSIEKMAKIIANKPRDISFSKINSHK
ncbi:polysaccharide deacetylase family protein [Xenorhabdus bharatensis]|uniref:polysaccharide deacetylase family protein n=1 Tax=Xenorhabdus bharatensis TaxID=3136256 RepID=UPI0030F39C31